MEQKTGEYVQNRKTIKSSILIQVLVSIENKPRLKKRGHLVR